MCRSRGPGLTATSARWAWPTLRARSRRASRTGPAGRWRCTSSRSCSPFIVPLTSDVSCASRPAPSVPPLSPHHPHRQCLRRCSPADWRRTLLTGPTAAGAPRPRRRHSPRRTMPMRGRPAPARVQHRRYRLLARASSTSAQAAGGTFRAKSVNEEASSASEAAPSKTVETAGSRRGNWTAKADNGS